MEKYYAFISYNHKDAKVAEWLHRKLESYRLPTEIHNELEAGQKYLRPIFRDKDELNAGILGNELRAKLEASKYLIVICSHNSTDSEWVSNEVRAFIEMGRLDRIVPLMVEEGTDVFPASLRTYTKEHPESELLGVSIPEVGKEKAFVRVVSKLLGVDFDTLWNRHKRQKRAMAAALSAAVIAIVMTICEVWMASQPKDILVNVEEIGVINDSIPSIQDAVISLDLGDEVRTDTLHTLGVGLVFKNVPAKYIGKDVRVKIETPHCFVTDTIVSVEKTIVLSLRRDPSFYGHIVGRLYDFEHECTLPWRHLVIAGIPVVTNANGIFTIDVPIDRQRTEYLIESTDANVIDDKVYMPCQEMAIINAE